MVRGLRFAYPRLSASPKARRHVLDGRSLSWVLRGLDAMHISFCERELRRLDGAVAQRGFVGVGCLL